MNGKPFDLIWNVCRFIYTRTLINTITLCIYYCNIREDKYIGYLRIYLLPNTLSISCDIIHRE